MNHKISIIVPVYNVEEYLKQCLDSLLNQTYQNLEIICVNDGSTDASKEILNEYLFKTDKIVVLDQKNQGLSKARNEGMKRATGEYIMFVDSDDWIDSCMCEILYQKAKQYSADVVMASYTKEFGTHSTETHIYSADELVTFDLKENVIRRLFGPIGEEMYTPQNVDLPVTACMQIIRRTIANKVDFVDTKKIGTEDLLYQIMLYEKCKTFVYVDMPLYHYRRSQYGTLTTKYMSDKYKKWMCLYDTLFTIISEKGYPKEFEDALYNRIALGMIGLGLNEILAKKSPLKKAKKLNEILNTDIYKKAYEKLEFEYFPLHWRIFFGLCKRKRSLLLIVMLNSIEFLRKRVKR